MNQESEQKTMSKSEVSSSGYVLTVIGVVASLLLFLAIMLIAYLPNQPAPPNEEIVAERKLKFADVQAKQKQLMTQYAWVDKKAGAVRIPVKAAMALTVQNIQASKNTPKASAIK
jgi:hypothetical protein